MKLTRMLARLGFACVVAWIFIGATAAQGQCGHPLFADLVNYAVGDQPTSMALADLDGDDWIDMAVADYASEDVSVLLNICGACPADVNGDGAVNALDLTLILATWGTTCPWPPCPQDCNGDGIVNVLDLLDVLAAWGPCP